MPAPAAPRWPCRAAPPPSAAAAHAARPPCRGRGRLSAPVVSQGTARTAAAPGQGSDAGNDNRNQTKARGRRRPVSFCKGRRLKASHEGRSSGRALCCATKQAACARMARAPRKARLPLPRLPRPTLAQTLAHLDAQLRRHHSPVQLPLPLARRHHPLLRGRAQHAQHAQHGTSARTSAVTASRTAEQRQGGGEGIRSKEEGGVGRRARCAMHGRRQAYL